MAGLNAGICNNVNHHVPNKFVSLVTAHATRHI